MPESPHSAEEFTALPQANTSLSRFLAPRFWPVWFGLAVLRLSSVLPHAAQMRVGAALGRALLKLQKHRRAIADTNLRQAFAQQDESEHQRLLTAHFESLGRALLETGFTWWGAPRRMRSLYEVEGMEHLRRALARGRGVILLAGHFTTIEIGSRLLLLEVPFHAMYRRFGNPLFEEVMRRRRQFLADKAIPKDNVRQMIRSLRAGNGVLYMPDQAHSGSGSVMAPFFGIDAPTHTGAARLAAVTGAAVVPFFPMRQADGKGYRLVIEPPLADFPSGNEREDAARINAVIEAQVRQAPEQYLWVHRRFKGALDYSARS